MLREKALTSRSANTTRTAVFSTKSVLPVLCESVLEHIYVLLAEFTTEVEQIIYQPETFRLRHKGKQVRYTPDFRIIYPCGSYCYVEVKDQRNLAKEKTVDRLELIKGFFKDRQEEFYVVSDSELSRNHTLIANLKHLKRYRTRQTQRLDKFVVKFDKNQQTTYQDLCNDFGELVATDLIANQRVWCDLEQEITSASIIKPVGGNDYVFTP